MDFIKVKTILSRVKYGESWYGIDYNMNLYRGCSHGCIYCDSRSNCYHIDNFDIVRGKEAELSILESELMRKPDRGVIGIGAMSDTYNPQERKYEITRGALKLIHKYRYGVAIDTKSDLILRDLDLLKEIQINNDVIIKFTITTPSDDLSKIIEPNAPLSSQRFAAIKTLSEHGIFVGIMLNPVLPFITDHEEDVKKLVQLAYENGAKFIHTYMGMTLRENQRDYYYQMLDKYFPGFKEKYRQTYDCRYQCKAVNSGHLYHVFTAECRKYGLLYRMKDIITAYKHQNKDKEQLNLFDDFL